MAQQKNTIFTYRFTPTNGVMSRIMPICNRFNYWTGIRH